MVLSVTPGASEWAAHGSAPAAALWPLVPPAEVDLPVPVEVPEPLTPDADAPPVSVASEPAAVESAEDDDPAATGPVRAAEWLAMTAARSLADQRAPQPAKPSNTMHSPTCPTLRTTGTLSGTDIWFKATARNYHLAP